MLCALIASLAVSGAPAAAEESGDSAPLRDISEGGYYFAAITGPQSPEEYPLRFHIGSEQVMRQVDEHEVVVEYAEGGPEAVAIEALSAHDADGATVPTTVKLTEGDIVTLTVHYKAGNPAAGGAPFVFPITDGPGWEGGYQTFSVELGERTPPSAEPSPEPVDCKVPSLRDLDLRAAKAKLRTAHCAIGKVRLAAGASAGKGRVVKQFRAAGAVLVPDAPVAIKLGSP